VPFSLVSGGGGGKSVSAQICAPLDSAYLLDYLEVTHEQFEPIKQSMLARILNTIASNDSIRGIETTERMLKTGTQLTAFAKIEKLPPSTSSTSWLSSGPKLTYRISKPHEKYSYILTPLTREALVDRLLSTTKTLKIFLAIFGSIGLGISLYCLYKLGFDYIKKKRREKQLAQARLQRFKHERQRMQRRTFSSSTNLDAETTSDLVSRRESSRSSSENFQVVESNFCVICLTNPRELVLLDCGHVCLCMDCFERMPNQICPICRSEYRSFLPCYVP
jgi:E3 ubiquitin-protein ligase MUL1